MHRGTKITFNRLSLNEKIVDFLIYLSIFLGSSIIFFKKPFEGYFHYGIYLFLLPFFVIRYGVPRVPFKILFFPLLAGIFQIALGNNETFLFVKIFGGVLLSVTFYYYVIEYYERDIERMFRTYLKWAFWTSVIALIQYISYKVGFSPGYDFKWLLNKGTQVIPTTEGGIRVCSIFTEPSQLGIMLGPAAFVAINNLFNRKEYHYKFYQSIIILLAIYLSRSSTGYLGLFLIILIIGLNYGYLLYLVLFITVALLAVWGLYSTVTEFKSRVDSSIGLWIENDMSIQNINSSSFVLYNNSHIAWENLKRHPIFGTGLGSHTVAYGKYSYTNSDKIRLPGFEFNTADANSLFLRLMSETGLAGIIFILFLIFRCFVPNSGEEGDINWVISGSMLIIILLYLFRQGNYFLNGFPFFVWLYYYNRVAVNERVESSSAEESVGK